MDYLTYICRVFVYFYSFRSYLIYSVVFLSACAVRVNHENCCQVNDDCEYLNSAPLSALVIPKEANIKLPAVYPDYVIPNDSSDVCSSDFTNKKVNICPPSIFSDDIFNEHCLVNE